MASHKDEDRDVEIPRVNFITELIPSHYDSRKDCIDQNSESWSCVFSSDESYFAWSSGHCFVTIVPWKSCKSALFKLKSVNVPFGPGIGEDDLENCFEGASKSIYTRYFIRSLAFGSSSLNYDHESSQPFWSRLSASKDLILATGHTNGRIQIWDILTGKLILALLDHSDSVSNLAFSPLGNLRLVSASYDGTLKIWDLHEDGNLFCTFKMNCRVVYSCCWSPDSKTLVSAGMSKSVYVWDMKSKKVKFLLVGHQNDVVACAFSPDGCLIASASWDTRVILWNSHNGQQLKAFGHLQPSPQPIFACGYNGSYIRDVSFSPDGAHIATVADDGYLRFWDIAKEEAPEAMEWIGESLCCTYSPSGKTLAVGNRTGSVTIWDAKSCVKSLKYISRIAVRKLVKADDVAKLFIPNTLANYLLYKEWEC